MNPCELGWATEPNGGYVSYCRREGQVHAERHLLGGGGSRSASNEPILAVYDIDADSLVLGTPWYRVRGQREREEASLSSVLCSSLSIYLPLLSLGK